MKEELTTEGVQEFLNKHRLAKGSNSKEMRLTIQEADRLSSGIAHLLSRYQELADKVIDLQQQLLDPQDIVMNGGDFG